MARQALEQRLITQTKIFAQPRSHYIAFFFFLGLWGFLWAGIGGENQNVQQLAHPGPNEAFLRAIASVLPFVGAFISSIFVAYKLYRRDPAHFRIWGPLGLTMAYGLVGVLAAFRSPSGWVSLYWSASYLAVPVVLLSVAWGQGGLERIGKYLLGSWFLLLFAAVVLFGYALIKLDFGSALANPSTLWACDGIGSWYVDTSGVLRSTGVGRYAAIAALLSLGGLWWRGWRYPAAIILVGSLALLLSTGARTALVGLMVGAPVVAILYGGKRTVAGLALAAVVVIPLAFTTGFHKPFTEKCLFHGGGALTAKPRIRIVSTSSPAQPGETAKLDQILNPTPVPTDLEVEQLSAVGDFFTLTGRTTFWKEGLKLIKKSPVIGYGFHADRMLIGDHIHNSYIYSMLQTGVIGSLAFVAGLILAWVLLIRLLLNIRKIVGLERAILISAAGLAAFFSVRTIPESTGAFFGIDWLILAPILLYLQLLHQKHLGRTVQ